MFVTLLHLITLAMLFIATMEKVRNHIWGTVWSCESQCVNVLLCVTRLISRWSPGGSGRAWRTRTCGTTVGLTTSRERGCAHPPKNPVRFHGLIFILNRSKSEAKTTSIHVRMLPQSGSRQCRSWWSCRWSSPPSPSWCSWVNCLPCPREDSSTSLACVKCLQVTPECRNVQSDICEMSSFRHLLITWRSRWNVS